MGRLRFLQFEADFVFVLLLLVDFGCCFFSQLSQLKTLTVRQKVATTKLQKAEEAENHAGSDEDEGKLPCNMSLKNDFFISYSGPPWQMWHVPQDCLGWKICVIVLHKFSRAG